MTTRWRVTANLALAASLAAVLLLMAWQLAGSGRPWQLEAAAGTAVGAAAVLRERHPVWALGFGAAVSAAAGVTARLSHLPREPDVATALALVVLVASAARVLPNRRAPAAALAALAATAPDWITASSLKALAQGPFIQPGLLLWAAALAAGLSLRAADGRRREAVEAVRTGERVRLAQELHDVTAHHLTGIVLQAQGARILARRDPEAVDGVLAAIEQAGVDALAATRRVVGLLRDPEDAVGGTSPGPQDLAELVRAFDRRGHGAAVRLELPEREAACWPPEVAGTVYRVVQESLTNISRHAPHARTATVTVLAGGGSDYGSDRGSDDGSDRGSDRGMLTVEVVDDAPAVGGPRHQHREGYGLLGMRERVEALGGSLDAGPGGAGGWAVRARLPLPAGGRR